jgi:threonine dehydrogenase-like Zn-dependent dehydrogenase
MIATDLLTTRVLQVDHLISHRFPLKDWGKAIDTARDPSKCMRSVVLMG